MGDLSASSPRRVRGREPAVRLFSEEYNQAHLHQPGVEQFDPSYLVSRLGAKINRVLVAGILERLERRSNDNGISYDGEIVDAMGRNYFRVAHFQPELHDRTEQLTQRFEEGETLFVLMIAKARHYANPEDGAIYNSLRPEELAVIDRSRYVEWVLEAADATLSRMDEVNRSKDLEATPQAMVDGGIPMHRVQPLLDARAFYGDHFDSEPYGLGVLQALDAAEAGAQFEGSDSSADAVSTIDSQALRGLIIKTIRDRDSGSGVEYNDVVTACQQAGAVQGDIDETIEVLEGEGVIFEPDGIFRYALVDPNASA